MDFDDYFAKRSELAMRVLADVPEVPSPAIDRHLLWIGGGALATTALLYVWASRTLTDAGYFARMSTFLECMLLADVCILIAAIIASAWHTTVRVRAREGLKERTVAQLIHSDRSVARQLASALRATA